MQLQSITIADAGLYHDVERHLIICMQHGFALIPNTILSHLRKKHRCKGKELHAVQEYLKTIQSTLHDPSTIHQAEHQSIRIPYITTTNGFTCNIPGCNRQKDRLSENQRTVEKHLSREHETPDRRFQTSKEHIAQFPRQILPVTFQSIFPQPYYRPFVLQDAQDIPACNADRDQETACSQEHIYSQEALESSYNTSRDEEEAKLHAVATDAHKSQIPPWLRSTGIAQWLSGLDKERVAALYTDPDRFDQMGLGYIYEAVYQSLLAASCGAEVGVRDSRMSRVSARILNSFEPDRMQVRLFTPVQESTTLRRYARSWSLLIACIIRMQSPEYEEDFGEQYKLSTTEELRQNIQLVALHAEQRYNQDAGEEDEIQDATLQQSVQRLSCHLTRSLHFESPFQSLIVQYCAFNAISKNGGWILAATFAPFLSGIIHCMQLWIVAWCMESIPSSAGNDALEKLIQRECKQFLVNSARSPIAELSFWRLLCWKVSADTILHPVTTINEDLSAVTHQHIHLRFDTWRLALHAVYNHVSSTLQNDLMAGLHGAPQYTSAILFDNPSNLAPGFLFLQDPRNNFKGSEGWLFQQIQASPKLSIRFFSRQETASSQSSPTQRDTEHSLQLDRAALESYLSMNSRFLSLLAVLLYMTAGLPPRREELVSITWRNWETARSLYISDGLVVMITGYHKSQWRVGNRPVARFLPYAIGNVLIRYIVYITPFLRFLRHSLRREPVQGFLFTEGGSNPWNANRISDCMQQQTTRRLGFSITTRQWRHMAIAIDRRLLQSQGCKAFQIKESFGRRPIREPDASDSDLDGDPWDEGRKDELHAGNLIETASHLQASHTPRTGNAVYGNSTSLLFGLTDYLLASFRSVSRRWHEFAGFGMEGNNLEVSACSLGASAASSPAQPLQHTQALAVHKRKASSVITGSSLIERSRSQGSFQPISDGKSISGSQLEVRAALWTWPAIERALQQLFGLHASVKSDAQRDALQLIASNPPECLIVMPTGGGKSLLFILPTLLPRAQVTVVITPLVALQQDLASRCTQWGINFGFYSARSVLLPTAAQPSLLLVDAERASGPGFQTLLSELHAAGRLDRIVLDEAHLLLTASHYREQLPALSILQRYRCPFICLTATIPPSAEREFRRMLCFTPSLERLRVSSNRPNLCYRIRYLRHSEERSSSRLHASRDNILVDNTVQACRDAIKQYKGDRSARFICYVREKRIGSVLAEELDCHFYHATLDGRDQVVTAWRSGIRSSIIIATTAFGAGVDYASVRSIIHVDAPAGMLDYAQETGRAGRDGLHADCLVLLSSGWKVDWSRGYRSNFLTEDSQQMTRFLESKPPLCLRMQLTKYLDGREGIACDAVEEHNSAGASGNIRCSHCMQSTGQDNMQSSDFEPEVSYVKAVERQNSSSSMGSFRSQVGSLDSLSPESTNVIESVYDSSGDDTACSQSNNDNDKGSSSNYEESKTATAKRKKEEQMPIYSQAEVYAVAEAMPRLQAMAAVHGLQLYEARVAAWSPRCIPCSFVHKRAIYGSHQDCMQDIEAVKRLRLSIQFARYIGCWKCGQPLDVCNPQKGTACMRSSLVFDVCWFALAKDTGTALDILHAAGAPLQPTVWARQAQPHPLHADRAILEWLGKKSSLYGKEASNAARLTHFWLDRLEAVCI